MSKLQADSEYLTAAQVRARYGGANDMWLHRRIRDYGFPAPVRFGGKLRFFRRADVESWERETAARDYTAPKPHRGVRS